MKLKLVDGSWDVNVFLKRSEHDDSRRGLVERLSLSAARLRHQV